MENLFRILKLIKNQQNLIREQIEINDLILEKLKEIDFRLNQLEN